MCWEVRSVFYLFKVGVFHSTALILGFLNGVTNAVIQFHM